MVYVAINKRFANDTYQKLARTNNVRELLSHDEQ